MARTRTANVNFKRANFLQALQKFPTDSHQSAHLQVPKPVQLRADKPEDQRPGKLNHLRLGIIGLRQRGKQLAEVFAQLVFVVHRPSPLVEAKGLGVGVAVKPCCTFAAPGFF